MTAPASSSGPKRVLSTHDSTGKIWRDEAHVQMVPFDPEGKFKIGTVVVQDRYDVDPSTMPHWSQQAQGQVKTGGVVSRIVELAVGYSSPMHYTHAVEYVTVLQGNLEVHGPGGEVSKLSQGDIFVSGAEAHQIVNAGSTPLRCHIVSIASRPIEINGKELSEVTGAMNLTTAF